MAWETLSMDSRKRKKDKIMRNIAATAEMIDITMVATTRHVFPLRAPPMHYWLSPIERGQFRFFCFCMKISLSNSMIFSRSPLLEKNAKIGLF